ncbi:S-layer homology domain-containing protein [Brevibacillus choshinensis]|uniref:S-layer homology domain-containing protein n=1 Tax=Brevibacillus choshinensis TaxID=54911 RepID=A0ABX7FTU5_BRECH|nr:S-layer homology domain-containing protein [Brevibacillus choshinensis]QRG69676.1 S-layer homology domain-containing protein [Brevibacillus choshinensis]
MKNLKTRSAQDLKKLLAGTLLAGMLAVPNAGFAATSLPLSDIASNTNKDAILKLNYAGVLKGYTDGTFRPDKEVTRAEFAKIAVLAMGYTDAQANLLKGSTKFKDLPASHWATGYINLAVSQGIIKGYPDGSFKPDSTVKIAEALTVYVQGLKINVNASSTGEWYYPYLLAADKAGIYDTKETPTIPAKRDIVAKYTDRFMETPVYANGSYYDKDGNADGTIKKLPVVKGTVASYDKATKKLKLTGQSGDIAISDSAQVYGNIVTGAQVEYIVKSGKVAFLTVSTADASIVEGVVKTGLNFTTAVGDEKKFKAIVNGKEVVLEVENGVSVSRSQIGQKFVAVMDEDGKVASITFAKNTTVGTVEKVSSVSGSSSKKEIKVDGTTYTLTSSATVKEKAHPQAKEEASSFGDIEKGDLVELTMDVDGKVTAATITKLSVVETIRVDTDENLISFGGYEYEVLEDTDLLVDEDEVSELDDLKDNQVAILTFDTDGNLTKVEQGVGVASNKLIEDTTAYQAGNPAKLATIKVEGKTYEILTTAKLTIDKESVSPTSIGADQLNDYRIISWKYNVGTKNIVELTLEKQTVTGYVTKKSGDKITVGGKVYQLASGVTIDSNAATNDKEYTLTLNNAGKVKAVTGAPRKVSGVVDSVEIRKEDGKIISAKVVVDGEKYDVSDEDAVKDVDQFEYATLTLNRDGDVTAATVQGKKAQSDVKFVGIESRVNGDKYVFFDDVSSSLKLAKDAQIKYYDGSELDEDELETSDKIDLWTNGNGLVYVIVVAKR